MPRFRIDRRTRKVYPIPSPTEDVPTYYFPHPLTEGDIMELLDSRGTPEEETTQKWDIPLLSEWERNSLGEFLSTR